MGNGQLRATPVHRRSFAIIRFLEADSVVLSGRREGKPDSGLSRLLSDPK